MWKGRDEFFEKYAVAFHVERWNEIPVNRGFGYQNVQRSPSLSKIGGNHFLRVPISECLVLCALTLETVRLKSTSVLVTSSESHSLAV